MLAFHCTHLVMQVEKRKCHRYCREKVSQIPLEGQLVQLYGTGGEVHAGGSAMMGRTM